MNYIAIANRYWQLHREQGFQPGESHLYWCLLNLFSSKGKRDVWPESLRFTDGALAAEAVVNIKTIDKTRKNLQQRGLIWVESKGQGARDGRTYWLADETGTYPVTCQKNGEVNGGDEQEQASTSPTTYPKNGEVEGEVNGSLLQQHTQQHTQELTQKMDKSLYIQGIETGNGETETFKKEKKEGDVFLSDEPQAIDAEKKDPNPQFRPPPSPLSWTAELAELEAFTEKLCRHDRLGYKLSSELKLKGEQAAEWISRFVLERWSADTLKSVNDSDLILHCQRWIEKKLQEQQYNQQRKATNGNNRNPHLKRETGTLRPTAVGNPDYRGEGSHCDVEL